jgi:predicted ATPase
MIKEFHAKNIFNKINCDLIFNPDINILTGVNGSGKTTILKLIWYILSGNIERIFLENIFFQSLLLITNKYKISLESKDTKEKTIKIELSNVNGKVLLSKDINIAINRINYGELNIIDGILVEKLESSVFFPTFRRIEGGFSTTRYIPEEGERETKFVDYELNRESRRLQESISNISSNLSQSNHKFVYSISTKDIIELVSKKFTEVANKSSKSYEKFASETINELEKYKDIGLEEENEFIYGQHKKGSLVNDKAILQKVKESAREVRKFHKDQLKPFTVVAKIVKRLYKNNGIKISDQIQWGYKKNYIDSNFLSSGEKQMLSFLCYNAFFRNSPIFIDEPEISLHPDWQRLLFSILKSQESNNQFIVATHSPLIYAKYSDKELII